MIKVLTFTGLYPSAVRVQHGVFVEHRLRHLNATGDVDLRVVAPVPWFPSQAAAFGEYAVHAATPRQETRHGIDVRHPRWLAIPKIGMRSAPRALARAGIAAARKLQSEGFVPDVIDAHYLFPDGVAAARLAKKIGKPFVLTARGSDVNLIPKVSAFARRAILDAVAQAASVVVVSEALGRALQELGADADKIHVIRNGVDRALFAPPSQDAAPTNADGAQILSVGNLVPLKGHNFVIDALRELPAATRLTIAGRGALRDTLEQQAADAGLSERVHFAGSVDQQELRRLYGSADALVLASSMEGLPNVLLEALACGTPVVATSVGGIPEVIRSPHAGAMVEERSGSAIATALRSVLDRGLDRATVRAQTDSFDWTACAQRLLRLLEAAAFTHKRTGRWSEC